MNLFNRTKALLSGRSFFQNYARQHGFELVEVKGLRWDLYQGDRLIRMFPTAFAASQYIYQLEVEAVENNLN